MGCKSCSGKHKFQWDQSYETNGSKWQLIPTKINSAYPEFMLRLFRWLLILASLFNFTPHRSPIEGIRYWVSEWGEHRSVCKYLVTNLNGLLIREGKCYSSLHKGAQESQCRGSSAAGPWMTRNDTRPRWSLLSSPPGECRHPALAAVTPVLWFARAGRRGGSVQCGHWSQSERGAARVQSSHYKQSLYYISL